MQFTLTKDDLSNLMAQIQSVVPSKPALPILSNFMLKAKEGGLELTATDLTVGIRCFVKAPVSAEGATTIPSRRFFQLVREMTAPSIDVHVGESDICEIKSASSHFKLNGMSGTDYPALPDLTDATRIELPSDELKAMLAKTAFAVSKDESRYLMTGILLKVEGGRMTFVGTDARRLAKVEKMIEIDPAFTGEYIIPLKAVDEIVRLLDRSSSESVWLYLATDKIGIETNNVLLVTKLLVGTFPDFKSVIPQNHTFKVDLHRDELVSMLRQIMVFADDAMSSCTLRFSDSELTLASAHHQIGEGTASMPVNYHGELFEIAFNPLHLLDILKQTGSETLELRLIDPFSPAVALPANQKELQTLFVIMPMRKPT